MPPGVSRLRGALREHLLRSAFPRGRFRLRRFGSPRADAALVVICLWNRHIRFPEILDELAAQDVAGGIVLGLWNNDRSLRRYYETEIEAWSATRGDSAISSVMITHSPVNTGGFGRFYMGRRLARELSAESVIFLDDDQRVEPDFVRRALAQGAPRTVASWWGWRIANDDYWDRTRALPGEAIDYAGTGGMVLDPSLLDDPELVSGLESEHWFLEDIWLSHLAKQRGWRLIALDAQIEFVMDETNQHHALGSAKPAYYRALAERRDAWRPGP